MKHDSYLKNGFNPLWHTGDRKNRWIFSHGFVEVKGDDTLR